MVKKDKEKPAANAAENIKVIVRCRPLNEKERTAGYKSCVDLNLAESTVQVNHVVGDPDRWTFDGVVNNTYSQKDVFNQFIMPLIDSVMDGFNATVFAYGQSGSGKTHTMTGKLEDEDLKGIIPRTFEYVFQNIREQQRSTPGRTFSLSCTFVELYNGKIHDLLAKQQVPLAVKENKDKTFFVQGVHAPQVKFPEDLVRHMEEGTERRRVASTDLNADSSRSHSLFTLTVDMVETDEDGGTRSVTSKFNLVDLAGSERQSKTGAAGDTLKEGCNINLSLSALGTVIDTLVKGKGHVPFRSSPLTMLLKDSLGGSSKTVMFANIGPSEHNLSETVSTLRFADRAKQIKNKPVVNMDTKDQKIQELTEQVAELKEKLKQFESVGVQKMEEELNELRERVGALEVDLDNATKGREADNLESKGQIEHLTADLAQARAATEEVNATLEQMKVEANLFSEQIRDEQAQRDEIWRACTAHFGEEVTSIDALLDRIRLLANSVPMEDHVKVTSDLRSATAAAEAEREAHAAELAQARSEMASLREELDSVSKKLDKTKEKLEKEKDARKTMLADAVASSTDLTSGLHRAHSDVGVSPNHPKWLAMKHDLEREHAAEVGRLQTELDEAIRRADEGAGLDELRAELASVTASKDATIADLENQIASLTAEITAPSSSDDTAVAHLKRLLAQRETSLTTANARVRLLEEEVAQLKQAQRSHAKHSSKPTKTRETRETTGPGKPDLRTALQSELKVTAEHRDDLLRHVIEGSSADLSSELSRLTEENGRLREQCNLAAEVAESLAQAQARIAELEAMTENSHHFEAEATKAHNLELEIDKIQALLETTRNEAAARETALVTQLASASGSGHENGDANPLAALVEALQKDKSTLLADVSRLEKELRATQSHFAHANAGPSSEEFEALQNEVHRLQELLSAPRANETGETALLRDELHRREDTIARLEHDLEVAHTPAKSNAAERETTETDELNRQLQEAQAKMQILELERSELTEQLDATKAEAQEATEKRDAARKELANVTNDFNSRGKEVSEAKVHMAELENKIAELGAELERSAKDNAASSSTIESLNARLKERTEQTTELRKTIEQLKELAEGHKQRIEQLKQAIAEKQKELAERDIAYQHAKEEQECAFQRMMNRRLEALAEEHKKALARKDDDIAAVRKKTKKVEEKLEKLKEKYDSKVYEYEELVSRMEEQKFEAMRNLRDRETVVIEEEQTKVQDALKAAKESRRRKADLFANGEVDSTVASYRPAGSAAMAARARGGVTPPSEDITTGRKSPRPAGYTVGRAVVRDDAPVGRGGAGYTGYVPEPPKTAQRPLNGGFDTVPDSFLDDGTGGGGDIYDF